MRARLLKPGFFTNEDLLDCSLAARLLFAGLWCLADRAGRLEDRPSRIKYGVFPGDRLDVNKLLDELHQKGLIQRYESAGMRLISIPKFLQHQRPHPHEACTKLPSPQDNQSNDQDDQIVSGQRSPVIACNDELPKTPPIADVITSHDEPLHVTHVRPDPYTGSTRSGSGSGSGSDVRVPARTADDAGSPAFDQFWAAYPRHEAKQRAAEEFKRLNPSAELLTTIVGDAKSRYVGIEKGLIPHPSTYLHQRRWEDEDKPSKLTLVNKLTHSGAETSTDIANRLLDEARENERKAQQSK